MHQQYIRTPLIACSYDTPTATEIPGSYFLTTAYYWYKQVKCPLVQALRLCTGRTVHRGSRGVALLFHDLGTRRGWGVSVTPRPLFTPGKDPVPIVQEAGWVPGPVRTGAENLASKGIRSPDRPAHSQSLYRLSYPAHTSYRVGYYYYNYYLIAFRMCSVNCPFWVRVLCCFCYWLLDC